MTRRKTKRDLEKDVEDLNDETPTDDDDPPTKAELGVTAGFVHFAGDDLQELPEGWTWESKENATNAGADFYVAVREDDQDEVNA